MLFGMTQPRNNRNTLKAVCAWCDALLRDGEDEPVTHGLSPRCANTVRVDRTPDAAPAEALRPQLPQQQVEDSDVG